MRPGHDILDRIGKLKNLAERPGTPAEAAVATAKLQALLFQYNLSLADLEIERPKNGDGYIREDIPIGGTRSTSVRFRWRCDLLSVLAQYNFCRVVLHPHSYKASLIGQRVNTEMVRWLHTWLTPELERMAVEARAAAGYEGNSPTAWARAFMIGAIVEIRRRLQAQRDQDQASAAGTALVRVTDGALVAARDRFFPSLDKGRASRPASRSDAFVAGQTAGRTVNLNPRRPLGG